MENKTYNHSFYFLCIYLGIFLVNLEAHINNHILTTCVTSAGKAQPCNTSCEVR